MDKKEHLKKEGLREATEGEYRKMGLLLTDVLKQITAGCPGAFDRSTKYWESPNYETVIHNAEAAVSTIIMGTARDIPEAWAMLGRIAKNILGKKTYIEEE